MVFYYIKDTCYYIEGKYYSVENELNNRFSM